MDTTASLPRPDGRSTVADRTEAELIAIIQSTLAPAPAWVTVGIGDDAAVVEPTRNRLEVFTVDTVVDGVHVDRRFTPPDAIGHRALAINLSDLAAMGAAPRIALLSLALPPTFPCHDLHALARGLSTLAARYDVHLVGGNLTRTTGPLTVDVTAVGSVKRRDVLIRGGARPGDEVYVSGTLGAATAGLGWLQSHDGSIEQPTTCVARYLYPEPRLRVGMLLARNRAASACMDLSDGLADGARRIASASRVGMEIDAAALPIEPEARRWLDSVGQDSIAAAIAGGDDYELLFTVRPRLRGRLRAVERHGGTTLTRIGTCTADPRVVLRRRDGGRVTEEPMPQGYTHFG